MPAQGGVHEGQLGGVGFAGLWQPQSGTNQDPEYEELCTTRLTADARPWSRLSLNPPSPGLGTAHSLPEPAHTIMSTHAESNGAEGYGVQEGQQPVSAAELVARAQAANITVAGSVPLEGFWPDEQQQQQQQQPGGTSEAAAAGAAAASAASAAAVATASRERERVRRLREQQEQQEEAVARGQEERDDAVRDMVAWCVVAWLYGCGGALVGAAGVQMAAQQSGDSRSCAYGGPDCCIPGPTFPTSPTLLPPQGTTRHSHAQLRHWTRPQRCTGRQGG